MFTNMADTDIPRTITGNMHTLYTWLKGTIAASSLGRMLEMEKTLPLLMIFGVHAWVAFKWLTTRRSQRITFGAHNSLHEDGSVEFSNREVEEYIENNYPSWLTAFHMVPDKFTAAEGWRDDGRKMGDEAEWIVYRLLYELGNEIGEELGPMFVIHSFCFNEQVQRGEEFHRVYGETDFVIVSRKHGVIFIEVKAVSSHGILRNGYKKGQQQIQKAREALSAYLKDKVSGAVSTALFRNPAFVAVPNCPRPEESIDAYKDGCFKEDCQDVECFLAWWKKNIGRVSPLEMNEDLYKGLLCRFIGLRNSAPPTPGKQVDDTTGDVLQMPNNQQLALMDNVGLPPNQLITGPAGSGKTEILLRNVQALDTDISKTGKEEKILVLCYNKPLREKLAKVLEKCHSVTVRTFDSILYELNPDRNIDPSGKIDQILEDPEKIHQKFTFDHIFVDEGQDFVGNWRKLFREIQATSKCKKKFRWVFFDNEQLVHKHSGGFSEEELDNAIKLHMVYRMTGSIFEQFKKYRDPMEETQFSIGHDIKGPCIEWDKMDKGSDPADPQVACENISKHVRRLLREKVCAKDICVLVRDKEVADSVMKELSKKIECQDAEDSITKPVNSAIIVDSIRRFKGLETKVLILYDPPGAKDIKARALLYTALSRCFCLVIIIAPKQVVKSLQSDDGGTPRKSPTKPRVSLSPRKTDLVEAVRALGERFTPDELSGLPASSVNSIQEMLNRMSMVVSKQQKSQPQHKRSKSF